MEPKKLSGLVRGELDWIVMKALEKDRNRRYESANGFAHDIQRYLTDEPVQACPPSAWYRFQKFTRRNRGRLAVAVGIFLLVAVILGTIGWSVRARSLWEEERQGEQAARQARAANELELALDRADLFQGQGKRAEALAAFDRAELLASQAPADPAREARLVALKERLAAEALDQEFIARYEEIRLRVESQVDVDSSNFNTNGAYTEIREALRRYGIEIGVMTPARVAARIQARPDQVRRSLVAALYDCLKYGPAEDAQTLLDTLDAADNDAWRVRVRKLSAGRDQKALEQLAGEADVQKQPPNILVRVACNLPVQTRLELLRRIQRAHPEDLWANAGLARELQNNGHPAEAIRYHTAALALRPDNAGLYLNRGDAFMDAGELDAAIADFRQSFALAPQYAEAHNMLGKVLLKKGMLEAAIAEYREALRLKTGYAMFHYNLGDALHDNGQLDAAIAEHREALRLQQDYPEARNNLGTTLFDKGQIDEAIDEYRQAIASKRPFREAYKAHINLGRALQVKGKQDEAIAEYREASRLQQDYALVHIYLGAALEAKGRPEEAVAEYHEAIRRNKEIPEPHYRLGNALKAKGRTDEAIAEFQEAIRCKKDYPEAHNNLGNALMAKGRTDEAIVEYRQAIATKEAFPEFHAAHNNLGAALFAKGQLDEAIAEYREAIRTKENFADPYHGLGIALMGKGQLDDAITAYREALRIKGDYAEVHCNLGLALQCKGEFRQALEALRRGHELGSKDRRWRYPSAQWVRNCERLVELDEKLPGFLDGKITPANPAEQIELAGLCSLKHLNRAAARFYEQAFAADPKLAADLNASHRYNAARAAALAGGGQGDDVGNLEDKEYAGLRRQALDWLRADMAAWDRLLDKEPIKARPLIVQQLQHWLADTDFARVRGTNALAKLPEAERLAWQKLWDVVADTLARAKSTPEMQ
jgi:tetratricopeptide (TPR) repeat protein